MFSMTPPAGRKEMTNGQINKMVESYRAMLIRHQSEFDANDVQRVLGSHGYVEEQLALFRKCVTAVTYMLVRHVTVNRDRAPQQVIPSGRRQYIIDKSVLATMPANGNGIEEVDIFFFQPRSFIPAGDFEHLLDLYGLKPDPYALAKVNEDDPTFAEEYPNGTQWRDGEGRSCYLTFSVWSDRGGGVDVGHSNDEWSGSYWWLAGVRK